MFFGAFESCKHAWRGPVQEALEKSAMLSSLSEKQHDIAAVSLTALCAGGVAGAYSSLSLVEEILELDEFR